MSKLVVNLEDGQLLRYSKIILQFPKLKEFLDRSDVISEEDLEQMSLSEKLYFQQNIDEIKSNAKVEWFTDIFSRQDLKKRVSCDLCHRSLKRTWKVTNRRTGYELTVGIECKDKFDVLTNDRGYSEAELKKKNNELSLLQEFNAYFPGFKGMVEKWGYAYHNNYIPKDIVEEFVTNYSKARNILKYIRENKIKKKHLVQFAQISKRQEFFLKSIENLSDEFRNDLFIPTQKIYQKLRKQNNYKVLDILRHQGEITSDTIKYIFEETFLNSFITVYNSKILRNYPVQITDIDKDSKELIICVQDINENEYLLNCSLKRFMYFYAPEIFKEEPSPFIVNLLLNDSKVVNLRSVHNIARELTKKFSNTDIEIDEYYSEYSSLIYIIEDAKVFVDVNIYDFINDNKRLILNPEESINKAVLDLKNTKEIKRPIKELSKYKRSIYDLNRVI